MQIKKRQAIDYIKNNASVYTFMVILFFTGIIFGAVIVNSMNFVQKHDLFFYLERFFGEISNNQHIERVDILKESFFYHLKYLLLMFILGFSVIGLPVVWLLLFLKGIVVGFSVGFIVNQLGMQGLVLSALSIAPQNLVVIPVYIVAGSLSMIFSLALINKLFSRRFSPTPVFHSFGKYFTIFLGLVLLSFGAAAIEAYIANGAMVSIIKSFYSKA
ncbi:stage II sporulation protein M [Virgibacillus sp. 179-BFC.A HS]|uniref:Stage II sporulation protein M n=1 Tax=Tigheibacillus jepli TaxID=3035914 RepID=A0ABU5CH62_9BACI|nr:stage II sporulation protein M [Virgibacillus sp. 179-BFC.A HS]MDY0405645.1 stage II sporulation protein M [Virgibacillus sp. 179-BFC.A HS]